MTFAVLSVDGKGTSDAQKTAKKENILFLLNHTTNEKQSKGMKSIQGHNNLGNSAFRRPAAHGLTCGSLRL